MSRLFVWGVVVSMALTSGASAQDEQNTAAARTLFHEGAACADNGDAECAADRWRRSFALRTSPVVAFNLGQVEAQLGHLVVASELFRFVQRSAEGELSTAAAAELETIAPRIAHVTIVATSEASIHLDGDEMQAELRGVPIPVDPGEHQLTAYYDDEMAAEGSFAVEEGQRLTHTFDVPPPAPSLEVVPEQPPEVVPSVPPAALVVDEDPAPRRRRIIGVTIGIAVAVAIGVIVAVSVAPDDPNPTQTDLPPVMFR